MTSPLRLEAMQKAILEGNEKKVRLLLRAGVAMLTRCPEHPEVLGFHWSGS